MQTKQHATPKLEEDMISSTRVGSVAVSNKLGEFQALQCQTWTVLTDCM